MPLHMFSLSNFISVAIAPVALITPTAILLGNFTTKYTNISMQMRALTAEYRALSADNPRRANVRTQVRLFHRRVASLWASSILLTLALLCFVLTVLAAVAMQWVMRSDLVGGVLLVVGMLLIAAAGLIELYEIRFARLTIAGEIADIYEDAK